MGLKLHLTITRYYSEKTHMRTSGLRTTCLKFAFQHLLYKNKFSLEITGFYIKGYCIDLDLYVLLFLFWFGKKCTIQIDCLQYRLLVYWISIFLVVCISMSIWNDKSILYNWNCFKFPLYIRTSYKEPSLPNLENQWFSYAGF